nr:glycosyl transferase [Gammaproteobacteria bacterium]
TNPQRAGPYRFQKLVVNHYEQALEKYYNLSIGDAPWGQRIQNAECMALIEPEEVFSRLGKLVEPL